MTYIVNVLHDLAEKYTTWNELKNYLTSESMRISSTDDRYSIIRYVKNKDKSNVTDVKWFRSVVWDTVTNRPVCVAPPKVESSSIPLNTDTTGSVTQLAVEEYLDGTMINVFRTLDHDEPILCTRTLVGAEGKFYSNKTFATLFKEALIKQKDALSVIDKPTAETPACFASFVLQHPEHRIVSKVHSPRILIIHKGSVSPRGYVNITENFDDIDMPRNIVLPRFPISGFSSEKELNAFFDLNCIKKSWYSQGITFKDGKGNRWRMRNPNYMILRELRGSEATTMDRFLRLRAENKVKEYLRHFSEDRTSFWDFEQKLRESTRAVFAAYCDVHKAHIKKLADVAWAMKPCVFNLHSHYLKHLKPNSDSVKLSDAVNLINNMEVYEQKRLLTDAQGPVIQGPETQGPETQGPETQGPETLDISAITLEEEIVTVATVDI
jgi:hypothetical protein